MTYCKRDETVTVSCVERITGVERSADGTIKLRVRLRDDTHVEACALDLSYRTPSRVICVSSQAGCSFRCDFCASGHIPFIRNLTAEEIAGQVTAVRSVTADPPGRPFDVTYMGRPVSGAAGGVRLTTGLRDSPNSLL